MGTIKKETINQAKIDSLIKQSNKRLLFAETIINEQPTFSLENSYEALRGFIDAKMYAHGLKSYSHEITINFLSKLNFQKHEIIRVDRLRK